LASPIGTKGAREGGGNFEGVEEGLESGEIANGEGSGGGVGVRGGLAELTCGGDFVWAGELDGGLIDVDRVISGRELDGEGRDLEIAELESGASDFEGTVE